MPEYISKRFHTIRDVELAFFDYDKDSEGEIDGYALWNVLGYTMVNRHAEQQELISDIITATFLDMDDIEIALRNLIALRYVEVNPIRDDKPYTIDMDPVIQNRIYVEDISGIERIPAVRYYLKKKRKEVISRTPLELGYFDDTKTGEEDNE